MVPGEFMIRAGTPRATTRLVHHSGHSFIAVERQDGRHETITFVVEDAVPPIFTTEGRCPVCDAPREAFDVADVEGFVQIGRAHV